MMKSPKVEPNPCNYPYLHSGGGEGGGQVQKRDGGGDTWFDRQLKMDSLWTHTLLKFAKPLFFHLYNIRRIWKFVSLDCTDILVNAFVTSRLDYYNEQPLVWLA